MPEAPTLKYVSWNTHCFWSLLSYWLFYPIPRPIFKFKEFNIYKSEVHRVNCVIIYDFLIIFPQDVMISNIISMIRILKSDWEGFMES